MASNKGNAEVLRLMDRTLGDLGDASADRVDRVTPLLGAIEPRQREVFLWLLAMLDLAVEYKEHSGMGYKELSAVFEPYLIPKPGMGMSIIPAQVLHATKKVKLMESLLFYSRALLAGYDSHFKETAPEPDAQNNEVDVKRKDSLGNTAKLAFRFKTGRAVDLKKYRSQTWSEWWSAICPCSPPPSAKPKYVRYASQMDFRGAFIG
jgi:hypothetical protein